jgi:hypothetical protein
MIYRKNLPCIVKERTFYLIYQKNVTNCGQHFHLYQINVINQKNSSQHLECQDIKVTSGTACSTSSRSLCPEWPVVQWCMARCGETRREERVLRRWQSGGRDGALRLLPPAPPALGRAPAWWGVRRHDSSLEINQF